MGLLHSVIFLGPIAMCNRKGRTEDGICKVIKSHALFGNDPQVRSNLSVNHTKRGVIGHWSMNVLLESLA